MTYVPDTHALVWFLANDPRLGRRAGMVFQEAAAQFAVPTLVLCEMHYLAERERIARDMAKILDYMRGDDRFALIPLDENVIRHLPGGLDIHDGIIVATALAVGMARKTKSILVTRDADIRRAGLVETIWE
ncbi:MAG: PIN domain-containing protein [Deltaproteobacteria bacterium]|nr:PIN domain-containing protein [Deltaproteobacteria bacterium]